ncbi:hypothetical protein J4427_02720 [Candidatus Woesearchaeota archaeon]|nr:hypothetical protein [Candidatus Woesearchaeota archaeon]
MKKAQIQIQETIIVIFIFIIILGVGLVLFYKFNESSIRQIEDDDRLVYFYNMIGTFPSMPEVKCSSLGDEKECIDVSKLIAFKNKGEFFKSNITIYTVYPERPNIECTIQKLNSGQDCGTFPVFSNIPKTFINKRVIFTPVSLYYPDRDTYELGKLVIEVYS